MALTGIEVFKLLPKTNCGDCGVPTCLAFAMNLVAGKAELAACPHVSEEAKEKLSEMAAPPMRLVKVGAEGNTVTIGGETVMFRHEKRFENPARLAILISDAMPAEEVAARMEKLAGLTYERVGRILQAEFAALRCESGDAATFKALVEKVVAQSQCALILCAADPAILDAAASACADRRPLLHAATLDNVAEIAAVGKKHNCPVVARGNGLSETAAVSEKLEQAGIKDIVIDSGARTLRQAFEDQVCIRSAALVGKFKPLGYPTMVIPGEITDDLSREALIACAFMAKYAGIIVMSDFQGHWLFPLLVGRLNIFTDPQRPLATSEGIYPIGDPDASSPVLVTSNFSLTYFIVSGEIANSRVPAWLLVKDTEGLSVLTAWAGGKFSGDIIGPFVKKSGIVEKINHRKLIIPGYLAPESGALEDELEGWQILVGPKEASNLPAYLKMWPFEEAQR
jgi:acetyl-CoA decarbonylase/synthase complex subunit gamma